MCVLRAALIPVILLSLVMLASSGRVVYMDLMQWLQGNFWTIRQGAPAIHAGLALSTLMLNTAIMIISTIIALVALIRGHMALTTSNMPLEEDAGEVMEPFQQQRHTSSGA